MFNKGDKYIHFTKYGGVNIGEVEYYGYVTSMDTINKVKFKKYYILTTKHIRLELDGSDGRIFKIEQEYTDEECINIKNHIHAMCMKKNGIRQGIYDDIILPKGSLLNSLRKAKEETPPEDPDFRRGEN